jgi:hypothetical protein
MYRASEKYSTCCNRKERIGVVWWTAEVWKLKEYEERAMKEFCFVCAVSEYSNLSF